MTLRRAATRPAEARSRSERLGFRVEKQTKMLVERAARIERRSVTEFCLTALTETARRVVEKHETLLLSERDRSVFFEALMTPPQPNPRLRRAFRAERERFER